VFALCCIALTLAVIVCEHCGPPSSRRATLAPLMWSRASFCSSVATPDLSQILVAAVMMTSNTSFAGQCSIRTHFSRSPNADLRRRL